MNCAQHDPCTTQVVLLDEAHERTVNTDVLLGLLKGVLARRPDDFRLVVMSATLDAAPMSAYFGDVRIAYVKVTWSLAGILFTYCMSVIEAYPCEPQHGGSVDEFSWLLRLLTCRAGSFLWRCCTRRSQRTAIWTQPCTLCCRQALCKH